MRPIDLPLGWPGVLRAIVAGPGVWATPAALVERLDLKRVYGKRWTAFKLMTARCREMIAGGWLEGIADGPDAVVTLSPSAADYLGVHLGEDASGRWTGSDLRRFPRERSYSFTPDTLEVLDSQPGPDELAEAAEEEELAQRSPEAESPRGGAQRSPGTGPHWIWLWRCAECEVHCGGVRLAEGQYCLCCGRSWWENAK